MTGFTFSEIIDILLEESKREAEKCDKFYEANPDANRSRQRDSIITQAAISRAMHMFANENDKKKRGI